VTSKGSDRMHALPVRVITKIEANQLNTKHLHTFCVVSSEHYGSTNRPGLSTSNLHTKGEITSDTVVSQNYKDSRGLVSSAGCPGYGYRFGILYPRKTHTLAAGYGYDLMQISLPAVTSADTP